MRENANEEILRIIEELRKLIAYASEVEQNIAPSVAVIPTLLANLTNELRDTRQTLEKLIDKPA
jgi:hypothetical protein